MFFLDVAKIFEELIELSILLAVGSLSSTLAHCIGDLLLISSLLGCDRLGLHINLLSLFSSSTSSASRAALLFLVFSSLDDDLFDSSLI